MHLVSETRCVAIEALNGWTPTHFDDLGPGKVPIATSSRKESAKRDNDNPAFAHRHAFQAALLPRDPL